MTPSRTPWPTLALLLVATLVAACGGSGATPAPSGATLEVVTTTTVLADLVHQVGGSRVDVVSLVPRGGEVHTFDPTPTDVKRVAGARLLFANGLGLDEWLTALAQDAGIDAAIVRLGEDLPGVTYLAGDEDGEASNPHVWLDATYAARYVDRIEAALTEADPAGAAGYAAAAEAYRTRLESLDAEIAARLGELPSANRVVVSFHDAFPYFAAAYGLTVAGSIVDAPGQDPSAGEVADLVATIRSSGVRAILAEAQFNPRLAETVAAETDAIVVTDLYSDSVGDAPADTYEGLMRWNTDRLVEALAAG
jgi:ABC-type Zn uptake system ZnuABC Zn-binding protein ZnuA